MGHCPQCNIECGMRASAEEVTESTVTLPLRRILTATKSSQPDIWNAAWRSRNSLNASNPSFPFLFLTCHSLQCYRAIFRLSLLLPIFLCLCAQWYVLTRHQLYRPYKQQSVVSRCGLLLTSTGFFSPSCKTVPSFGIVLQAGPLFTVHPSGSLIPNLT
ncbi:hypothetical protein EDD36DRAFT_312853 [Exophiala viscosa]|uniref:Uncharacterized protein n=1 Tax=Exophiala viscosa TaxID=2486360 RepID=A0AAN6DTE2_9EURO|nr:hypothetical protein EDD36DRAFT_312853 [Exophiala viscosa]